MTGARVREITVDDHGLASGAVYIDRNGTERRQKACRGDPGRQRRSARRGCSSCRRPTLFPDGLANSSGLVGKNLMMHPYGAVVGTYEDDLESWLGPAGQSIESHGVLRDRLLARLRARRQVERHAVGRPAGHAIGLRRRPVDESWGANFHRNVKANLGRSFEWGIIAEDLPDEANRVMLDPALTDSDGIPAPKLLYTSSENTSKLIDFHVERATGGPRGRRRHHHLGPRS